MTVKQKALVSLSEGFYRNLKWSEMINKASEIKTIPWRNLGKEHNPGESKIMVHPRLGLVYLYNGKKETKELKLIRKVNKWATPAIT